MNLAAHAAQGVLTHEEQHGYVVCVGSRYAGQCVGCPRSCASQRDTDLPGGAGVAIGDFHAHAFVAGGEYRDLR